MLPKNASDMLHIVICIDFFFFSSVLIQIVSSGPSLQEKFDLSDVS